MTDKKVEWEAVQDRGLTIFVVPKDDHPRCICEVHTGDPKDAHLIAAAPDMLEALANMLGAFDNPIVRRKLGAGGIKPEAIRTAKAAIEKAWGKS